MRSLFGSPTLILCLFATLPAAAATTPEPPVQQPCGVEEFADFNAEGALADQRPYINACIRTTGYLIDGLFFEDLEAFARRSPSHMYFGNVGYYPATDDVVLPRHDERAYGEIVARVYSCKAQREWSEPEIERRNVEARAAGRPTYGYWPTGFCHYATDEPFFFIWEWRALPEP